MLPTSPLPIRTECPPGTCICERESLLNDPTGDMRVLLLTRMEERKLIARIESISTYADLLHMAERIQTQLGIVLQIAPGTREVRTVRGLTIELLERPGLCKKIRQSIPAAIRKCLDKNPEIVYAILDAHDLFSDR